MPLKNEMIRILQIKNIQFKMSNHNLKFYSHFINKLYLRNVMNQVQPSMNTKDTQVALIWNPSRVVGVRTVQLKG